MTRVIASAAVNELRDNAIAYNNYSLAYERATLLELGTTNVCLRSQEIDNAAWANQGAPTTVANAATAPDGTATADSVEDTSGAVAQYRRQDVVVANDSSSWTVSQFIKAGTAGYSGFAFSLTGGTELAYGVVIDWSLATITAATASGGIGGLPAGGFSAPTRTHFSSLGNGWYRVSVTGPNNSSGNVAIRIHSAPAVRSSAGSVWQAAATGLAYFWGAQIENLPFPTSYVATTSASVSRSADLLSLALPTGLQTPRELSVYVKFIERGTIFEGSGARILHLGDSAGAAAYAAIYATGGFYVGRHETAAGFSAPTLAVAPVYGDQVELLLTLGSDGKPTITQSINAAATTSSAGSAQAFVTAWAANTLYLNSFGTNNPGAIGLQSLKFAYSTKTMAEMRALADMASTVLILGAGATTAIYVDCEDATEAEAIDIGIPLRSFAGSERGFTRDQKRQATVTTGFLTETQKEAIQAMIANRVQINVSGTVFNNETLVASVKMTGCQLVTGTPLWRMTLQVSEV